MRHVFDLDVLACPRCGGRVRVVATIQDPAVVRAFLAYLTLAPGPDLPGPAPARPLRRYPVSCPGAPPKREAAHRRHPVATAAVCPTPALDHFQIPSAPSPQEPVPFPPPSPMPTQAPTPTLPSPAQLAQRRPALMLPTAA